MTHCPTPADDSSDTLRSHLTRLFGHDDFRPGQREIVEAALSGVDTLAVMPTGGGKSLTFQMPAMLVPESEGATLVLSPLIALMKDQAENLPPDVAARTTVINSSLDPGEVWRRLALVRSGRLRMIYAAPERLRQPPFLHALRSAGVALVVIDEAHCISQWGHDFRPDYRAVGQAIAALNPRAVLAVTATATSDVQDDIERQIGRPLRRIVQPTYRDNLFLDCRKVKGEDEKLWATLDICRNTPGSGLVYAGSREKCERLSAMLRRQGIAAGFYHAGLPQAERAAAQDDFMSGRTRVMAATVAFGMGVDKPDIRFLVHYNPSRTLENYYQEAGRAGRDGLPSRCTLLISSADAVSANRHLREDAVSLEQVRAVYNGVRQSLAAQRRRIGTIVFDELAGTVGGDEGTVRSALPLLEEAGLLARHVDVPRRLTVEIHDDGADFESTPEDEILLRAVGDGGGVDPGDLGREAGVRLPEVEEALLRLQDAGRLTYRAGQRDYCIEMLPAPADTKQRMEETLRRRAVGGQARVDAMLAYARDRRCRHAVIARYFGDRWPNLKCGLCDVCAGDSVNRASSDKSSERDNYSDKPAISAGEAALSALRVVSDLADGYRPFALGKAGLTRALRGAPDAPIKPERTTAFGALSAMKRGEVERLIDALVERSFLRRDDEDEYRRLYLTEAGREALTSGAVDVGWSSAPAPRNGTGAEPAADVNVELYEALRTWRRATAEETNVPAFVVFADKVITAVASRQPANEFELTQIAGIGPAKAARYGDTVLEIVRKHRSA